MTVQIAKQLKKKGYIVTYCCPKGDIEKTLQKEEITYIEIFQFTLREVKSAIKRFAPDVVYAVDYRAGFYASLAFRRVIVHLHSDCEWLKQICVNSFALCVTAFLAKSIICVSDDIYKHFVFKNSIISQKFITAHNVVSKHEIYEKSKAFDCCKRYDVGYCGRMAYPKNPIGFVQIVSMLKEKKPDIQAIMIGCGELDEHIRFEISQMGLTNTIDIVGFQSNPFPYICACTMMVMPSLWEGFPMVAIEAMILGKPLVATSVSGVRDIVTDACGGIRNTMTEITDRVLECLEMPSGQFQKMKDAATNVAERYSDMEAYIASIEGALH